MTLAEHVVDMLLDNATAVQAPSEPVVIDPRQHPDIYKPKYQDEQGNQVYSACANCEVERFGRSKRYAPGTDCSHGFCQHHMDAYRAELARLKAKGQQQSAYA